MKVNKDIGRLHKLREKLHEYNFQYYVNDTSIISDFEFDKLLKELENLEEKYPSLSDENSPTKRVGGQVT